MKMVLLVPLEEKELQELLRLLLDRDEEAALAFAERHLKPAAHRALDSG